MRIETKYEPKQQLWYMEDNKPKEETVWCMEVSVNGANDNSQTIRYIFFRPGTNQSPVYKYENECFPTKEELLKSL